MMEQVGRASGRSNVIDAKQQFVCQGATLAPDANSRQSACDQRG